MSTHASYQLRCFHFSGCIECFTSEIARGSISTKIVKKRNVSQLKIHVLLFEERIEPTSPRENHGDVSWVVNTPRSLVPTSLHLLALQLKPSLLARFVSAVVLALHIIIPFGFNPSDATGPLGIGV